MHPTISAAISTKIRSKQYPRGLCEIWRFCDFVFVQTNRNIVLNINFLWMGLTFRQLYCIIHIVLNNHELLTLVLLSPFFCSTHIYFHLFKLSKAYALLIFLPVSLRWKDSTPHRISQKPYSRREWQAPLWWISWYQHPWHSPRCCFPQRQRSQHWKSLW